MTNRWLIAAWVLVAACLGGCPAPATTRPAPSPEPGADAKAPLPDKALQPLADLKPVVSRPANAPGANFLGDQVRKIVEDAEAKINRREYVEALPALQQAIRIEPKNPRIHRALGLAYSGMGSTGQAREHLTVAIEQGPDDLTAQLVLGRLAAAEHKTDQAIAFLRTGLACTQAAPEEPRAAEALVLLGRMLEEQGRYQAALDCYEQFAAWADLHGRAYASRPLLKPLVLDAERLMTMRGGVLMALRRYDQAIPLLEGAHRRNRSEPAPAGLLMRALITVGKFPEAEKLLVSLANERGQEKALPTMAQWLCVASGDRAMPRRVWDAVSSAKASGADVLAPALANAARRLEDYDQARAILESADKSKPGNAAAARMLADLFVHEKKWDQALRVLAGALAADPAGAGPIAAAVADVARGGAGDDPTVALRPMPAGFEKDFAASAAKDATPAKAALCYVAGHLAKHRGQLGPALDLFKQALAADKAFLPAYDALAGEYLLAKQYDQAEKLVAQLRQADPAGYFGEYLAGRIAMARGWVHSAVAPLALAQQRNEKHRPTLVLLAKAYDQVGRHADAEAAADHALALDADDPPFCQWYFDRALANKQFRRAGAVAELVAAQRPNESVGPLMQAEVLLRQGDTAQAAGTLESLAGRFPPSFRGRLLGVEVRLGQPDWMLPKALYDQAVKDLREAVAKASPADPVRRGQLVLARLLSRGGRAAEACEVWSALQAGEPLAPDDARMYAASLVLAGKDEDAAKALADLVLQDKGDDATRHLLLEVLLKLHRTDAAVRVALSWQERATKEHDPKALAALDTALAACRKAKQHEPALKLLDRLMEDEDDEEKLALFRGAKVDFLHLAGRDADALQAAEGWIASTAPNRGATVLAVTEALIEARLFAGAHGIFDKAIANALPSGQNSPAVTYLRSGKGMIYRAAKDVQGGEAFCRDWEKASDQARPLARQMLIDILLEAEQYDKAAALLTEWLAASAPASGPVPSPEDRDAMVAGRPVFAAFCRRQLVFTLRRQGKLAQAAEKTNEFLAADPADIQLLLELSLIQTDLGKPAESARTLEKARELNPDSGALANNLGYQYADMGVNLARAEELIRQALADRPALHIEDSLGWVFYKQGRLREAGALFQQLLPRIAAGAMEQSSVVYDHAGDVYYRLGWKDLAAENWAKAMDLADQDKTPTAEVRAIKAATARKLAALKASAPAVVAPLGEGVKE